MDLAHGLLPLASQTDQVTFLYLPCHPAIEQHAFFHIHALPCA